MKLTSKELYNMLSKHDKDNEPVLKVHYKIKDDRIKASVWEKCGLIRVKEIKLIAKKVFSIRFNRTELLKHTSDLL